MSALLAGQAKGLIITTLSANKSPSFLRIHIKAFILIFNIYLHTDSRALLLHTGDACVQQTQQVKTASRIQCVTEVQEKGSKLESHALLVSKGHLSQAQTSECLCTHHVYGTRRHTWNTKNDQVVSTKLIV